MRARDGVKVVVTTAGRSGSLGGLSGGYRYQGDPSWTPGDPRYREAPVTRVRQPVSEERAKRIAAYSRLRDEGLNITEAGRELGIARKTAQTYERERRALRQQQGAST